MKKQTTRGVTFVGREHEPPVPTLTRRRHHELAPGMVCEHISVIDEKWVVRDVWGFWCQATKGHGKDVITQMFPCDALLPVIDVKHTKAGTVVKTRTKADVLKAEFDKAARPPRVPPNDEVTKWLAEAETLNQLWALAHKHGLPADLREKLAHLNHGLQRMNIGNRLRALLRQPPPPPADRPAEKAKKKARRSASKPV
jgi:hypothetical protein